MSAATPRSSWALMVSGPPPCDFPSITSTDRPVDFSNSGSISRKGAAKPPDVITLTWAKAGCGAIASTDSAIAMPARSLRNSIMNTALFCMGDCPVLGRRSNGQAPGGPPYGSKTKGLI